MRGSFAKKQAKVASVNLKKSLVTLEGIQRSKREGSKVAVPFNPRALQIKILSLDDKHRLDIFKRKTGVKNASN